MRLLILGDTHFTTKAPARRIDEYYATQLNKFEQALKIYNDKNCDIIIQVGDLFDSPYASDLVKVDLIKLLDVYLRNPMLCVYGQHDIFGHAAQSFNKTPMAVLEAANYIYVVRENGYISEDTCVQGASYGEEIPAIHKNTCDMYNVLVIHEMIGPKDLYPGQNIMKPRSFLKSYDYDLVCCGDYHYSFIDKIGDRIILNPGALLRKTINDNDLKHKPCVMIVDTEERTVDTIYLDIKDTAEVFDLSNTSVKNKDEEVMEFINQLKKQQGINITWQDLLEKVLDEKKIGKKTRDIVYNEIEEMHSEN